MANLLKNEDSPYLLQHKDNPVHWMPWCDEAFIKAKDENKAIFISIGYSSCHWCHVMEHEVFGDKEIANRLNEEFVCIKVDKEERPDIDKFYQNVHILLNRRTGGWPTSIFSTPQNEPFFAGTYIPSKSDNDTLGFGALIEIISAKIAQKDKLLFDNALEVQRLMQPTARPNEAAYLKVSLVNTFMKQCEHNFDENSGGFGLSPKFPQVSTLHSLLNISLINQDDTALHMLTHTLDSMIQGGMYDLVHSGFCRYSTDQEWLIPHFEKMSYDNALFIELYTRAYQATKNKKYLHIAQDTASFMLKYMSEENLFYSSSDADSDGKEGKYFVYDYQETLSYFIANGFEEDSALELFAHLHITPAGNFEGNSIIRLEGKKPKDYNKAIQLLADIREQRPYPFIDKKIISSCNAMMIKSLFLLCIHDKDFKPHALAHLDATLNKLYKGGHLFHTAMIHTGPKIDAFLEDYAYLSTALIQAYQNTLNKAYLLLAQELVDKALSQFFEEGKWYFSKGEFVTDADIADSSYPGSVGVIIDALLSLGVLIDEKYRTFAFTSLEYYSTALVKKPVHFPYLFNQSLRYIKEDRILKGNKHSLEEMEDDYFKLEYPFLIRLVTTDTETLLCGVQSCYTHLNSSSDLDTELKKTL